MGITLQQQLLLRLKHEKIKMTALEQPVAPSRRLWRNIALGGGLVVLVFTIICECYVGSAYVCRVGGLCVMSSA